jgi:hypothetical protein
LDWIKLAIETTQIMIIRVMEAVIGNHRRKSPILRLNFMQPAIAARSGFQGR